MRDSEAGARCRPGKFSELAGIFSKNPGFPGFLLRWWPRRWSLKGRRLFRDSRRKEAHLYKVGDKVVYPHHGAGTVVKKEKREVLGQQREYLTIKILHNDMTVQVPSENADKVGLRRVIGEKEVGVVPQALTAVSTEMPKNWNPRF